MNDEEEDGGRPDENEEDAWRREEAMRRNTDFIVQHQAQFASDIQSLGEVQARNEERWARTEEGIRSLPTIAEIHEREITALRETTRDLSETTRNLKETTRATDERLNAPINLVWRDISERRDGKTD